MAGSKIGGQKTAVKNLEKDPDFYKKIGSLGGKNGTGHAFAHGLADPSACGRKGGTISRRTKKLL
jgi:general stress protein YciG